MLAELLLCAMNTSENLCGIPDEIWLQILRLYLGYDPDVGRILRLGRVCKKMYILVRDASLWTEIWITKRFPPLSIVKGLIDRSTRLRRFSVQTPFTPYNEMIKYVMENRGDTVEEIHIECMYTAAAAEVLNEIVEPIQRNGVALRKFQISGTVPRFEWTLHAWTEDRKLENEEEWLL